MSIKTNNLLGLSNKNIGMARPYVPIPSSPWVRDPNWPALPSVSGLQKFSGLAAIFNSTNNWISFEITVTGTISYTVDWGDGTSNTYTTSGVQFKNISYAGISASPITHSGQTYKPCIITVTVNTGNMTFFNLQSNSWTNALGNTATFLTGTSTSWLDIAIEGQYITTLTISNSAGSMRHYLLESCYIGNMPLVTSFQNLFYWCVSLRNVSILNSINVTNMISMFVNCYSLTTVSLFNTQNVTDMGSMFNLCYSLTTVPLFNTQNVTNMTSMFNACRSLTTVPLFNTQNVQSTSGMFTTCNSLTTVPLFNTIKVTDMSNMFNSCSQLTTAPLFNTIACTSTSTMFQACYSLTEVPLFNTQNVQSTSGMFASCFSLTTVPLFNTIACINMSTMFQACYSLTTVPLFNTQNVTNISSMFQNCFSLTTVPLFNTIACTTMSTMFQACYSLTTVPLFNTQNVQSMQSMFNSCFSLTTVPLFNTQNVTVMTTMFNACNKLESVPLFNTIACNSMNNMLSGCSSIKSIPLFNMPAATTAFSCSNTAISSVPALSYANNTGSLTFTNNGALSQFLATGISRSLNVGSCNLFKDSLELIFTNLNTAAVASQIITITSNPGADTAVSKTMVTDSTLLTHTMADTSGLVVGMTASGTGMPITSGSGVSFIDAGDLVDLGSTSYQIPNNTEVSVSVLITTTGITLNRIYYVVNSTPRYFQLSLTQGGAAIALTTNGSGTIKYRSKIVSIVPNVSVTLDTQVGTTGSKSVTFRMLDTSRAIMKNYSITG
jgi:surface protein